MKQTAQNTFQDGLNYDLHPLVTPNSVLTDNINGTFITYNGNEFCLQNDRGNNKKVSLPEGHIPIGIKEHNGILYIVSVFPNVAYYIQLTPLIGGNWEDNNLLKAFLNLFPEEDLEALYNCEEILWPSTKEILDDFVDALGESSVTYRQDISETNYLTEIGTYPSINWNEEYETIQQLNNIYSPIKTLYTSNTSYNLNGFLFPKTDSYIWTETATNVCSAMWDWWAFNAWWDFCKSYSKNARQLEEYMSLKQIYNLTLSPTITDSGYVARILSIPIRCLKNLETEGFGKLTLESAAGLINRKYYFKPAFIVFPNNDKISNDTIKSLEEHNKRIDFYSFSTSGDIETFHWTNANWDSIYLVGTNRYKAVNTSSIPSSGINYIVDEIVPIRGKLNFIIHTNTTKINSVLQNITSDISDEDLTLLLTNNFNKEQNSLYYYNYLWYTFNNFDENYFAKVNYNQIESISDKTNLIADLNNNPKHPITIEIQDSYDGSVNLILIDNNTPTRLINSGFSVVGDKGKKIKHINDNSIITTDNIQEKTKLTYNPVSFMNIDLIGVYTGGQLKGGNYTFYIKLGDSDGNETDILGESSIVSIFNGVIGKPSTNYGTLADERTNKLVKINITDIPNGYSNLYLYAVREYSDVSGYSLTEAFKFKNPYSIYNIEDNSIELTIFGTEEITSLSVEDLNIQYFSVSSVRAIAQQQDMLFVGNIHNDAIDYEKFDSFAKLLRTSISNISEGLDFVNGTYTSSGEYYDPQNIYSKLGYWPNEYYRFGIVFLLSDGSKTNVFNMCGGSILDMNYWITQTDDPNTYTNYNEYGVFKTPIMNSDTSIINSSESSIKPWYFIFDPTAMINSISESKYKDQIKGFFIVRQKRIPEVITQGLQIAVDKETHIPLAKVPIENNNNIITKWGSESFVDSEKKLKYAVYGIDNFSQISGGNYLRLVKIPMAYIRCWSYSRTENNITWKWSSLQKELDQDNDWPVYYVNLLTFDIWALIEYDTNHHAQDVSISRSAISGYQQHSLEDLNLDSTHKAWSTTWDNNDNVIVHTQYRLPTTIFQNEKVFDTASIYASTWGIDASKLCRKSTESNSLNAEIGGGNEILSYFHEDPYYVNLINNAIKASIIDNSGNNILYTDPFVDTIIESDDRHFIKSANINTFGSGILSVDAITVPIVRNTLNGSVVDLEYIGKESCVYNITENDSIRYDGTRNLAFTNLTINENYDTTTTQAVYIADNTPTKGLKDIVFTTVIGNAYDIYTWGTIDNNQKQLSVVRGNFTPFIGISKKINDDSEDPNSILNNGTDTNCALVQLSNRTDPTIAFSVRKDDDSPFYCVSNRFNINNNDTISVYRGDCYTTTQTVRMIRNFVDPDYPYTESIINENGWENIWNNDGTLKNRDQWELNRADLNTVSLGHWVTFKCLSNYNIGLRSIDSFHVDEQALLGNVRAFYPLLANTATSNKIPESALLNDGYSKTTGVIRNQAIQEIPYVKQEYATRIMFSNKNVQNQFINGYRIFQGLSYHDYDKQYGEIVKLIPWGNNLFCVFEHGLAILPVNEKALLQTTTEQTIHIYGHGVLPDTMSIVSQDYGSQYEHSVIRTPLGIYGIDVDAKKIWRFTDKQGFETISDMKVETFLEDSLRSLYNIELPDIDVRTHYNAFKGDIIFTWYDKKSSTLDKDKHQKSICFNERQSLWTTQYDWVPIVSENINGDFYTLQECLGPDDPEDISDIDEGKICIYSHDVENSDPTKWYGKQHKFEFEFVVSDPIGVHKIFDNLQIISNNVQPEEMEITVVGDDYEFKRVKVDEIAEVRTWYKTISESNPDNVKTTSDIHGNLAEHQDPDDKHRPDGYYHFDKRLNQSVLTKWQPFKDIYKFGRRIGNIQYRGGMWYTQIEPLLVNPKKEARIRDKWAKIRIRYTGKDLAVITAIKTLINI